MYFKDVNIKHVPLQQGTIINGCIAEHYKWFESRYEEISGNYFAKMIEKK